MNLYEYLDATKLYNILERRYDELLLDISSPRSPTLSHARASNRVYVDRMGEYLEKRETLYTAMLDAKEKQIEAFRTITAMIETLPDVDLRETAYYRFIKGLRITDIAELMEKSTGMIHRYLRAISAAINSPNTPHI